MFVSRYHQRASRSGYTVLILLNLLILLLIGAVAAAYYFYRLSSSEGADEFSQGRTFEEAGQLAEAEEAYREAVRLDPLNAAYKRRLNQLAARREQYWMSAAKEVSEGKTPVSEPKDDAKMEGVAGKHDPGAAATVASAPVEKKKPASEPGPKQDSEARDPDALPAKPVAASPALWPAGSKPESLLVAQAESGDEEERSPDNKKASPATSATEPDVAEKPQDKSEDPKLDAGDAKNSMELAASEDEKEEPVPAEPKSELEPESESEPEPETPEGGFRLAVIAPDTVDYRVEAEKVDGLKPGEVVQDWTPAAKPMVKDLAPGQYAALVRTHKLSPWKQSFVVKKGGDSEDVELGFGVVIVESEPGKSALHDGKSGRRLGRTPYTLLRPPGEVNYKVKASGYEDLELSGEIEAGKAMTLIAKLEKPEPKPEPEPAPVVAVAVAEAITADEAAAPTAPGAPEIGKPFMNGDGMKLEFRPKSSRGDPFWRTMKTYVNGMSREQATDICRSMTIREKAAGRVPSGYAYFPSAAGDGRLVLCVAHYPDEDEGQRIARSGDGEEGPIFRAQVVESPQRVVVSAPAQVSDRGTSSPSFGQSFVNGDGVKMDFRPKDYQGNPFWRGQSTLLARMTNDDAGRFLYDLTTRERAAGRVPDGYTYAREFGDTGRYVLVRVNTTQVNTLR